MATVFIQNVLRNGEQKRDLSYMYEAHGRVQGISEWQIEIPKFETKKIFVEMEK